MMKPLPQIAEHRRSNGDARPSRYRYSARPGQLVAAEAAATDIVGLIRGACSDGSRRAVRVATADAKGSLFFDSGHIVHAEFGEDYGLRALAPMLRAGPFVVEPWHGPWPSQPSLHLGVELLLSMVGRETPSEPYQLDTRVIRKVEHRATEPPPLPESATIDDFGFDPAEDEEPLSERLAHSLGRTPRSTLVRATARREAAPPVKSASPPPHGGVPPASAVAGEPSSMVRVSARGTLLAAHGRHADRLADAAAFIHGLANSIAVDLGGSVNPQAGRAAVHLRGRGRSLFVVRSEVGDIAAALGRTKRLASLLRKVGLR
jgi:hypothetical protein